MKKIFTLLLLAIFLCTKAKAQIRYVKAGAAGDASSWASASGDLKAVLKESGSGTEIWVAGGTYYPTRCAGCDHEERSHYFEIPDGVALYGGFSGSETQRSERNIAQNPTILSGDIDRDGHLAGNAYTVVYTRDVSEKTIVDGFTITGASASSTGGNVESYLQSGGWYNDGSLSGFRSNPTVRNCIFTNNEAISHGAAMFNYGGFAGQANPSYENCVFSHNRSTNSGGAIYNSGVFSGEASAKFVNCSFLNNETALSGGAVYNNGAESGLANPSFTGCHFTENSATADDGGAVYNFGKGGTCSPDFTACHFEKNNAHRFGGAVVNDGSFSGTSRGRFESCTFLENRAESDGGAIFNLGFKGGDSSPDIEDCQFYNNHSTFAGGALFNNGIEGLSSPSVINCMFYANQADTYGGAMYNQGKSGRSNPMIINCIFYKNTASSAGGIYNLGADQGQCDPIITNCSFYGNRADVGGAIYSNATDATGNCSPAVTNCIIWGNKADFGPVFRIVYGTPNISYSLVGSDDCEGMYSGVEGNITCGDGLLFDVDPLFVNAEQGNLHLRANSPVIDKGNNVAISATGITVDLDRHLRQQNGKVDMGAYEYGEGVYTPPSIVNQPAGQRLCEGSTTKLDLTVQGSGPFYYQWEKDGQTIGGATKSTLQISPLVMADAGNYRCRVSGPRGEQLYTDVAVLEVLSSVNPAVTVIASDSSICGGATINFNTTIVHGGDTPVFQWMINGAAVGGNNAAISLASLKHLDQVSVRLSSSENCAVQNPVVSEAIEIQVDVDPSCLTSTVSPLAKAEMKLVPNPTRGWTQLHLQQLRGNFELQMINLSGQVLYRQWIGTKGQTTTVPLDLSAFANGVYLLRLAGQDQVLARRIIKY